LIRREPHLSGAVGYREPRDLLELFARDAAHRNRQPDVAQRHVFLAKDADVVRGLRQALVRPCPIERPAETCLQRVPDARLAPFLDEKRESDLVARVARTVITKQQNDGVADLGGFFGANEDIERPSDAIAAGAVRSE